MKLGLVSGFVVLERDMLSYEALSKHGIDVTIFSNQDYKLYGKLNLPIVLLKRWGQYNKIPVLNKGIQYFFPYDRWMFGLKKATKEMDFLNSWEIFNPFSYGAIKTGKPTVITAIDNIPFNYRFSYNKIVTNVKEKAAHFIAGTNTAKYMLMVEGIPEDKISVIPLPVDTKRFKPITSNKDILKKYSLPERSKKIFFTGRILDSQKGVSDLVYAFYKLAKDKKNTILMIGGSGPDLPMIRSLVEKLGLQKKVHFLGFIPDDELVEVYNACDIFCGPSRITKLWQEQFGYTMTDAMSCGKPVISTLSGSIPDVVLHGKTGLLAGVENPHSLYKALLQLIDDDDLREKFGKNSRKFVEETMSVEIVAKKTADVYKKLH